MARPTLVSLAKELGVSRQTVSNVINAPHLVKPETRERVQAAIERTGYRPNYAAQALRNQRSQTLAMRIYPSSDGIYGAVMDRFHHQLVREARTRGYNIMPITAEDDRDEVEQLISLHDRGSIDGCLISGTSRTDVRPAEFVKKGLPMVAFGRPWSNPDCQHYWVDVDGAAGTMAGTTHFIRAGFERIGFVGMLPGSGPGDDRREGWRSAMRTAFPAMDLEGWDSASVDSVEAGVEAANRLFDRGAQALVCASDSLAFGSWETFRQRGGNDHEVPVIGFDGSPVARAIGMSSVAQPVETAVQLLVEALLRQVRDDSAGAGMTPALLDARLVLRGQSAC
ncbi:MULTISPECIES: LacI family DNA-binding transcriptional regulator [unclassified Luteococcus]|uniref:LacI family DNA-binding transcriptional regulator n=1 Tax=unclassified Luteococcus TaxID=2639923 RepID=UPI00313BB422